MVFTTTYQSSASMTAISGGGCNASGSGLDGAWQRIAGPLTNTSSSKIEMWMGKIITAGASTITVTNSVSTGNLRLNCKEFDTLGGQGTIWTQDGVGGSTNNAASTTVTFPTMTPSGINRLYVGFGTNGTGQTTGATAGYTVELDPGTNPMIYNPSVPNSAQTPISTQASSGAAVSYLIAALIYAITPAVSIRQTPVVPRFRSSNY